MERIWLGRHDHIPAELVGVLYSESMGLAESGLGGIRISKSLSRRYSLRICPGTINHWIYGEHRPRIRNLFEVRPSPALSYVIGASIGDGCKLAKSGCVKLEVTDLDFAENFNSCMSILFNRHTRNRVIVREFSSARLPLYVVKYISRPLTDLLSLPLERLLVLAFAHPREFLRGFFDAEGHVDVSAGRHFQIWIGADNSSNMLLQRISQELLRNLRIGSRIYKRREAGTIKEIRGQSFAMRRASFSLLIRRVDDVRIFANQIGFSIPRKNIKLRDALAVIANPIPERRSIAWRQVYFKNGGEWTRRSPRA